MAVTHDAVFPQTLRTATAVTTAAATYADDAPANTVALGAAAGADGAELWHLSLIPRATCSATVGHVWSSPDGGTTKRLVGSIEIAAQTVNATTGVPTALPLAMPNGDAISKDNPMRLEAGETLYVGTTVALASGFVWRREGADY